MYGMKTKIKLLNLQYLFLGMIFVFLLIKIKMAISSAYNFIKYLKTNNDFRQDCFRCRTKNDLISLIDTYQLQFTEDEFSNAINGSLLKCQTEDEALEVKQIEWFYHLLP